MSNSKRIRFALCTASILALGFAQSGWSVEPLGSGGVLSHPNADEITHFVEGLNPEIPVDDSRVYAASWFALPYTPSVSYLIDRVDLVHGEGTGTIRIQIRSDNNGVPSETILTECNHELEQRVDFQGCDMPSAALTAGTLYWVAFEVPLDSQASVAEGGHEIDYLYGSDGSNWRLRAQTEAWIARFFGSVPSPVTPATWGTVKARYRHSETLGRP